jgi:peptide/nickel transport system substrate-binding protein
MSMLLVACGTAATPTAAPTTAPATSAPATSAPATAVATTAPAATAAPTVIPVTNFPRNETLYTGGTQWGPVSTFNPFNGGHAMGTLGLVYETLFLYDPMTDTFIPWLASSGSWTSTSPATYEIKLRSGLTWQDGQPLTADDVVFTWNLAKTDTLNFSDIWSANELTAVNKVDAQTVDFVFGSTPPYQEFANYLYNVPVVPQHLFSTMSAKDVETGTNPNPVGSGPYKYYGYDQTKMIWERNDSWWGIQALGYKMAPKYIIDLVNTSNQNSLGLVLQGDEDLNNNYLPGIATLLAGGYPLETYYPSAPYNLSVNTAWLEMNLQEKPLSDLAFRQALAYGIDPAAIVSQDYDNMVQAADPTGLLPVWSKYEDQSVIKQYGVTYDPAKVKTVLTAAGYKMGKDGFWTEPDGTPINLTITCPQGWSDWMEALTIIQTQLAAVGIQVTPTYPAAADWTNAQVQGKFDLTLNNAAAISNTPWSYYNWMFYSDLADIPTTQGGNFDRYNNPALFALVAKLGQTPTDDLTDMQSVISQIQTIQLQNLPIIPLWYNGAWAQMSTANWTNWPGSGDGQAHYYPVTWNGYWNMTAILMLANLKPATP